MNVVSHQPANVRDYGLMFKVGPQIPGSVFQSGS